MSCIRRSLRILRKFTFSYWRDRVMDIFKIEGHRIDLREFQISDLDEIYNITLQPEIAEFLPDWIASKE